MKEKNNIEVDANFFKNKIVCIWDDVVTTGTSFCAYTAQLEQAEVIALAKADENVKKSVEGMNIIKEIYVKGRLVNIVVKP